MKPAESFRLDGKVALVTGAGRGIGGATAIALAAVGADVALVARTQLEQVASEVRSVGRCAAVVIADIGRELDANTLVARR